MATRRVTRSLSASSVSDVIREPDLDIPPGSSQVSAEHTETVTDDTKKSSKLPNRVCIGRCPCNVSSNGKAWLLTCNGCGQVWHNHCANLKGDKITQDALDSILKHWQCPWCFVAPFPCPQKHKSGKIKSSLDNITHANEFLSTITDSLKNMVDKKLTDALKTSNESMESIGKQLLKLSSEISSFKNGHNTDQSSPQAQSFPHASALPQQIPTEPLPSQIEVENPPITHSMNHLEDFVENYLTPEEEEELSNLLDNESFVSEGNRGVLQYGEYYKYMGSKTKPKAYPDAIKKIMDRLNEEISAKVTDRHLQYTLNSCLVNKYQGSMSSLPEHSDDEGDICPWSSIFTVSIGSTRTLTFRNTEGDQEIPVYCMGRSMYEMTRASQNFYKHQIKDEPEHEDPSAVRYSLTFRAVHWSNFNSSVFVGDSNFGKVQFGSGKGKVGQATPGLRTFAAKVSDIDPVACASFRNVVVMVGTNDLKNSMTDPDVLNLYKVYKLKITQIRQLNPKAKIFLCPVLPTKSSAINQRVFKFNRYICNDLIQSNLKALLVEGFFEFVDNQSFLLRNDLAVSSTNDILHINNTKGLRLLVSLVKQAIFRAKKSRTVDNRTYSNVTRGGPANPI